MSNDSSTTETPAIIQPYSDAELDQAMRELEAIEAAERDRKVLAEYWQRKSVKRGFASHLSAWLTMAGCMLVSATALADEPKKAPKPVICLSGAPVPGPYFMCTDGKRPRLLLPYIEVQFVTADGQDASYVLGWPAKNGKPVPLPKRLPRDAKPAKRVATVKL